MVESVYDEALAQEAVKEFQARVGSRGVWESYWDDIAELVEPPMRQNLRHGDYSTPGDRKTERQMDSTPTVALTRFSAAMDSLLTPRNQTWHRLVPSDRALLRDHETRLYFEELNRILFAHRYEPQANFSSQNQLVYRGLGAFGTSSMFIDKLATGRGLRYKYVHVGETYLRDNHQGIVDDCLRRMKMKPHQILERWRDVLSLKKPEFVAHAEQHKNEEFDVLHWVRPRKDHDPEALDERAMPYESVYILVKGPCVLETGGYHSFPYASTRYDQAPNEVYGRSPAMQAFAAIKTLNVEKRIILTQGHRAVNPVLLIHDDGLMENVALRPGHMVSGGMNADGRPLVGTLPAGDLGWGQEMMEEERAIINDAFLVTLFQILVETPRMTATEVIERASEKGMLLAPTVGRQQSEYLGPAISREIDVLNQQGLLPEYPPALAEAEGEYTIVYDSPLSKLARAEEAAGFSRVMQVLLPAVNITQDPSIFDSFNFDTITRDLSDLQSVPASWMRSPEEVMALRDERARQQEAQLQLQAAPAQADLIKAAATAKKAGLTDEDIRE